MRAHEGRDSDSQEREEGDDRGHEKEKESSIVEVSPCEEWATIGRDQPFAGHYDEDEPEDNWTGELIFPARESTREMSAPRENCCAIPNEPGRDGCEQNWRNVKAAACVKRLTGVPPWRRKLRSPDHE
jgi:hypothetical protein